MYQTAIPPIQAKRVRTDVPLHRREEEQFTHGPHLGWHTTAPGDQCITELLLPKGVLKPIHFFYLNAFLALEKKKVPVAVLPHPPTSSLNPVLCQSVAALIPFSQALDEAVEAFGLCCCKTNPVSRVEGGDELYASMDAHSPAQERAHMTALIVSSILWWQTEEDRAKSASGGPQKRRF